MGDQARRNGVFGCRKCKMIKTIAQSVLPSAQAMAAFVPIPAQGRDLILLIVYCCEENA